MSASISANSLVTLHYRISALSGLPFVSTFESGQPATLKLGVGEMMPVMENCLLGLALGTQKSFELVEPFGPYREELIEEVARVHMGPEAIEPMSIMEFSAPDGSRYPGLVREIDEQRAKVDFNHPLAGQTVRFEVQIVGVI